MVATPREELAWRWGLLEEDVPVVFESRGDANRIGAGADLCTLRCTGAFVARWQSVPLDAVNFLANQLGIPPRTAQLEAGRRATVAAWRERIRRHLGYRTFGEQERDALKGMLSERFELDADETNLAEAAKLALMAWQALRPGTTTLDALIREVEGEVTGEVADRIVSRMDDGQLAVVDDLIAPVGSGEVTPLDGLKSPGGGPNEQAFQSGLDLIEQLSPLQEVTAAADTASLAWQRRLCSWVRRHDAWALRRVELTRRRAMVVCFIAHHYRELLDEVVELNHALIDRLCSNAKKAARKAAREAREAAADRLMLAADALEQLLAADDANTVRDQLRMDPGMDPLREAIEVCRDLGGHTRDGYTEALLRRYSNLRRFEPRFLRLPLQAEPGSEALVEGVRLVVQLDDQGTRTLPESAPTDFVPRTWRRWLRDSKGKLRRSTWETALVLGLNDALKRGDIFVTGAQRHNSFSQMLFDDDAWAQRRDAILSGLGLESDPQSLLATLDEEIEAAATSFSSTLSDDNAVIRIDNGALVVGRDRARHVSPAVRALRRVIHAALPSVRIEQILVDVDALTGFGAELAGESVTGLPLSRLAPLAAALAEGANLDRTTFAPNVEGVSRAELERALRCLTPEVITNANDRVVSTIVHHAFDPDRGEIVRTSSDGQRFGVDRRSRLARYYPRQFGIHHRALTLYGHHNLGALFAVGIIACGEYEALHVVDALLDPQAIARPNVHHSDTHGVTLALFGLCHLLDIELQPWLSKPATRHLYASPQRRGPEPVAALFHGDVNRNLIAEQWDTMLRVVGSLTDRRVWASTALKRMSGSRLGEAFEEFGKLVRTRFLLRFFGQPDVRRTTRRALNLTESRHKLSRKLCLGNQGRLRGYNLRDLSNRASALTLLSNCVVAWNTLRLNRIVADLRAAGTEVSDEVLAGCSPFKTAHIQLHGTYRFQIAQAGLRRGE